MGASSDIVGDVKLVAPGSMIEGKIFQQTIMDWYKKHEYGKTFLTKHWTELLNMVVAADERRRKAPGYNPDDDIVNGAVTGNNNR